MSKINEFAKDIILTIFRTMFNYWYIIALVVLIVYFIGFLCHFKLFRKAANIFQRKNFFGKAIIVLIIIFIIAIILN